jgi:Spy/CpxP family protein refolding chaperone
MSDNRVRIWFSLFVLAVFCVGVAGGVLADRAIMRRISPERMFDGVPPGGPMGYGPGSMGPGRRGGPPSMLIERLTRDLDLTADQKSKIETVLTASRTRVETLQRDVHDRFVAEQQSLRAEIRKVLTPAQQEKFDQRERERGWFGRRGPPPPPPQ